MIKIPKQLKCPFCEELITLEFDGNRRAKTTDLVSIRVRTPILIDSNTLKETNVEVSICIKCNSILGVARKM